MSGPGLVSHDMSCAIQSSDTIHSPPLPYAVSPSPSFENTSFQRSWSSQEATKAHAMHQSARPSPTASPLLQAMRDQALPPFQRAPSSQALPPFQRAPSSQSTKTSALLERVSEMAERSVQRTLENNSRRGSLCKTSPASSRTGSPRGNEECDRRASVDSTYSRGNFQRYGMAPYRDAFAGVRSAYAEYNGMPPSRASSTVSTMSFPTGPRLTRQRFQSGQSSGQNSPVITSRQFRQDRKEILREDSSSDDPSPKKKRSPKKSTHKLLKSLGLHASDVGSSSDSSPSPRSTVPAKKGHLANSSKDMQFTTSSTDDDRSRRRAWEDNRGPQGSSGREKHRRDRRLSPSRHMSDGRSRSFNNSDDEVPQFPGHESVLESARSVVKDLERGSRVAVDLEDVHNVEDYLAKSRGISPAKSNRNMQQDAVAPGLQDLLAAVFRDATGRSPSSAILSASESPKMKSPQIIVGNKEGHKGFLLHTVPAYRPASDPEKDIGLPVACLNLIANCFPSVYQVTGKYNLPTEQRNWGFEPVSVEECFDDYSWWRVKAIQGRSNRNHGVYVEEPRLLPAELSAFMNESQKFGMQSQFVRSKYRTQDRRTLGPKFDDYSPHVPKKSEIEKLPLEYRKMLARQSKERPGIRKSYMDEVLRKGTAVHDKHRAVTWDSVEAFFHNQSASTQVNPRFDTHQYC